MSVLTKILQVHQPKIKYKVIKEIAQRWSPRYFSPEPVSQKHLKIIFEAARWAPSAHNYQPWYYFYTKKDSAAYKKLFFTLNKYNQSWAKSAPLLVLACAIIEGKNPFAFYDLGASVISLILQARSLGYYCRQMGLFDQVKVKQFFKLEKNLQPFIVIAMGKIGNYENAPQEIIKMEFDPRPRKIIISEEL